MFKNGDVIEYLTACGWIEGTYIGKYPTNEGLHVICATHGVLRSCSDIRKPKVKKVGWVGVYLRGTNRGRPISSIDIFNTEEEARNVLNRADTIAKIEWEE